MSVVNYSISDEVDSLRQALADADVALDAAQRALSLIQEVRDDVEARLNFAMATYNVTELGGNLVDSGALLV